MKLFDCVAAQWSPGIGDPTVMGWFTVFAYTVTAVMCLAAARLPGHDRKFWAMMAIVLLCLAVNKQLDLQSALTAAGRCLAKMQGWYGARHVVQFIFILGLLATSSLVMLIAFIRLRHRLRHIGVALLGFGLLLTFIAVRAVGFHHFDLLIRMTIGPARMNWVLELSGLALILANAVYVKAAWRRESRGEATGRQASPR